mmetsp:Transcript_42846/g.132363  ORF Transcript_42846/g.132363 Transcript_42846/m.132363 type:complete len:205 (-) Transcript_42846:190-804(-)
MMGGGPLGRGADAVAAGCCVGGCCGATSDTTGCCGCDSCGPGDTGSGAGRFDSSFGDAPVLGDDDVVLPLSPAAGASPSPLWPLGASAWGAASPAATSVVSGTPPASAASDGGSGTSAGGCGAAWSGSVGSAGGSGTVESVAGATPSCAGGEAAISALLIVDECAGGVMRYGGVRHGGSKGAASGRSRKSRSKQHLSTLQGWMA